MTWQILSPSSRFCNKYDIGELEGLLRRNPSLYIVKDETSIFAALLHPDNPVLHVIYHSYIERLGKPSAGCGVSMVRDFIAKHDRIALGIMRQLMLKGEQVKQGRPKTIFELSSDSGSSSLSLVVGERMAKLLCIDSFDSRRGPSRQKNEFSLQLRVRFLHMHVSCIFVFKEFGDDSAQHPSQGSYNRG